VDLQQVLADEIKVKRQEGHFWMALAIMVSTRLWLGSVVSAHRDLNLIQALADKIKGLARCRPLLLAVDGLASYVTAFRSAVPLWHGKKDRPKLVSWPNIAIVQVVKRGKRVNLTSLDASSRVLMSRSNDPKLTIPILYFIHPSRYIICKT